jgi:hypothetical protein
MFGNRHDEKAVIIAAVFLNLRVHKLDNVRVVHSPQNGDFIPEASDPVFPLQPLQRVSARKRAPKRANCAEPSFGTSTRARARVTGFYSAWSQQRHTRLSAGRLPFTVGPA